MGKSQVMNESENEVDHSVDPLFEPIKIKSLELKNRIIMPAMGHGKARGGVLGPMLGALTLTLLQKVLFSTGVSSFYTGIFQGVVMIVAVLVASLSARLSLGGGTAA